MTNDWLNQKACKWGGNPKDRYVIHFSTKRLKDAANISILQSKSKLNSEKPETHVEYLRKG
jgi:hypothetical protein